MSVSCYPFNFLPFKLPKKIMDFSLPLIKLSNKRREEYSKSILFIHLHSILFPSSKHVINFLRPCYQFSSKHILRPCHQFSKINVFYFLKEVSRKQRAKRSYNRSSLVHEGFFSLFNIINTLYTIHLR